METGQRWRRKGARSREGRDEGAPPTALGGVVGSRFRRGKYTQLMAAAIRERAGVIRRLWPVRLGSKKSAGWEGLRESILPGGPRLSLWNARAHKWRFPKGAGVGNSGAGEIC